MFIVFAPNLQAWLTADSESGHRDDDQPLQSCKLEVYKGDLSAACSSSHYLCDITSFPDVLEWTYLRLREQKAVGTIVGELTCLYDQESPSEFREYKTTQQNYIFYTQISW